MNRNDLFESIGEADETMLKRSERKKRHSVWIGAVAAVLAVVICVSFPGQSGAPVVLAAAEYPEAVPYPTVDFNDPDYDAQYEAWWNSRRNNSPGYADNLNPFFAASMRRFLGGEANSVVSPVNLYMALAMLSELTEGESRQQILTLLNADSQEALRVQANTLWNAQYKNDGATTSILASSFWIQEGLTVRGKTVDLLAENYYASSYQGEMGSPEFDAALQEWISTQTGDLLKEQAGSLHMTPETLLALASTVHFESRWLDEFDPALTAPGVFHSPCGELEQDFMHMEAQRSYYWGEGFGAVGLDLNNGAGTMWLILPDRGITPEQLLQQEEIMEFLASGGRWENQEYMIVNLSVPKFDISSDQNLCEGLQAMGISDVFDPEKADFSPIADENLFLSNVKHAVRVTVDEEGMSAAAYTVMIMEGAGRPPEERMDFTLDRPFLFAVTSGDHLPLFAGIVNQP